MCSRDVFICEAGLDEPFPPTDKGAALCWTTTRQVPERVGTSVSYLCIKLPVYSIAMLIILRISYERIVERIYRNPVVAEWQVAERLLGWIVCAKRALKWHEIQGAVSIGLKDRTVDFDERRLRIDMKDICGSLVEIHPEDTIELVHVTARLCVIHNCDMRGDWLSEL